MQKTKQFIQSLEIVGKNMVGASRFERPTSCSQGRRANQAALRPDVRFSRYFRYDRWVR